MKMRKRRVLVCDCEKTMPLGKAGLEKACRKAGGDGELFLNTQLCRSQIENYQAALESGEDLLVACTQEAPLFSEVAEDFESSGTVSFTNIRETAGWSKDAEKATPKIAALLAAAAVEPQPFGNVTLASGGNCLIYGPSEQALEAARQLSDRLQVTVLLSEDEGSIPPDRMSFPVFSGRIRNLKGHLGGFEAEIENYAIPSPSSRSGFSFEGQSRSTSLSCDLLIDLSGGTPLLPAHDRQDGYLRPDPGDLIAVQKALLEASGLVGEFEKPRYVRYDESICAHSRSRQDGCNRCIDACPLSAIQSLGDTVEVDPYVCGGCGLCAATCPTGAMDYRLPDTASLAEKIAYCSPVIARTVARPPSCCCTTVLTGESFCPTWRALARACRQMFCPWRSMRSPRPASTSTFALWPTAQPRWQSSFPLQARGSAGAGGDLGTGREHHRRPGPWPGTDLHYR
ncbi:4Fe-4S binding protein [Fodinicurvata halophila]|uniref:4Fe-4S binding protein n=1 Tax=Fodinicurvata halophila TaxID=1419723 RepID=UPI0036337DD3